MTTTNMMTLEMIQMVCNEVIRYIKGKDTNDTLASTSGISNSRNICSIISFDVEISWLDHRHDLWIVDYGSTNHITPYIHLFHKRQTVSQPITINFLDGASQIVHIMVDFLFNPHLFFYNVLYVP